MKFALPPLFFSLLIAFTSCKNVVVDDVVPEEVADSLDADSIPTHFQVDTIKKKYELEERAENLQRIEKKYGEQWGFCACVIANDSIDRAVKALEDFESDEAEKLFARFDLVASKCQAFLGTDSNRTPEERAKHEKKVKKCLRDSKASQKK